MVGDGRGRARSADPVGGDVLGSTSIAIAPYVPRSNTGTVPWPKRMGACVTDVGGHVTEVRGRAVGIPDGTGWRDQRDHPRTRSPGQAAGRRRARDALRRPHRQDLGRRRTVRGRTPACWSSPAPATPCWSFWRTCGGSELRSRRRETKRPRRNRTPPVATPALQVFATTPTGAARGIRALLPWRRLLPVWLPTVALLDRGRRSDLQTSESGARAALIRSSIADLEAELMRLEQVRARAEANEPRLPEASYRSRPRRRDLRRPRGAADSIRERGGSGDPRSGPVAGRIQWTSPSRTGSSAPTRFTIRIRLWAHLDSSDAGLPPNE